MTVTLLPFLLAATTPNTVTVTPKPGKTIKVWTKGGTKEVILKDKGQEFVSDDVTCINEVGVGGTITQAASFEDVRALFAGLLRSKEAPNLDDQAVS